MVRFSRNFGMVQVVATVAVANHGSGVTCWGSLDCNATHGDKDLPMWNAENILKHFDEWKWRLPFALLLIAALTAAVYSPVLQNGFVDYDDPDYVTVNMMVRQGVTLKGFLWSLSAFHAGNWHPLTWLSHMLDIQMFGLNPGGHHAVSLLLHILNALLLCLLLDRLTGFLGRSALVSLLFALHPLHVESVAWISERKDVLSTAFWLLTMFAYAWYAGKPSAKRYLSVAALFGLGLMAKQMLVTLPLALLLMDYWPLQRLDLPAASDKVALKRLLLEKLPLLALSAAAALATIFAQDAGGALHHGEAGSLLTNLGNGLIAYVKYLGKMLWPADLALFYPFDAGSVSAAKVAGAAAILAVLTGVTATQWRKRRYLVVGWLWYLITLLPVIGFIRIGSQSMADRYTYVPLIGIFIALVWGVTELVQGWKGGAPAATAVAVALLALMSLQTVRQIGYWRSSYDLYSHALSAVEENWLAHNNMGILLAQQYRFADAINHFSVSLRINPNQIEGYRNLGTAYQSAGNNVQAVEAFREAARLNPDDVETHFRLGYAYLVAGNPDLAYQEYLQLQRLDESRARPLLDSIKMVARR
jgi:protein O-mannosyl-transferase